MSYHDLRRAVEFAIEDLRKNLRPGEYSGIADRLAFALQGAASDAPPSHRDPFTPPQGCTTHYICAGVEGRYTGWVMVLHPDGQWVTAAKLTAETAQMLRNRFSESKYGAPQIENGGGPENAR